MGDESLAPNTRFISLIVNQQLKIFRPNGFPGKPHEGLTSEVARGGFKILYPALGKFIGDSGGSPISWVIYQHLRSGKQVIEFLSTELGTTKFHLVAQGVQVHDHASIEMGGPAFATYYTEPTTPTQQEGG